MAIDPSIALSTSQGGNLLQTLSAATQLKGIQQQQAANQAASAAYKQATDPNTGQVDYNLLTSILSQGPAAYNLPQIQAQVNEAKTNQLNYDAKKLELAQKRTDLLSAGFGGLLQSGNITPQAVMQLASTGIRQGLFSPADAVNFTSDMPSDPAQLQAWAKQKYVGFSTDSDRLKTLMPQNQTINTGAQQVVASFDPLTGGATGQTTVFNNQLSPEAASQPTQVFDPATGTMRNVTRQQFANMANGVPQAGGQGGYQGGMGQPSQGGLGSGRIQAPQQGAPGLQAAPALGQQVGAEVSARGSADASLALQNQADNAPQAIYQLQNMRKALSGITTGPNANWQGKAQALALQVAPGVAERLGIDPQKVASQEEFNKYSVQLAQELSKGLGNGTDEKLASAVAATPNLGLSKLGNQQIIDVLISTQRGIAAKNQAWQSSGLSADQYNKWSSQWNKDIDPRVFALQDMDNAQAWKSVQSLPKKDQDALMKSWNKAAAAGYVQ